MTWDPTQPPTGTALLSAPIRENFQALDALVAGGVINPMTAPGDLIRGGPAGAPTRLAPGTNGHVLTLAAGLPTWAALPADVGFVNPMTTLGDLIVGAAAGVAGRLGIGTDGQRLTLVGGLPVWQTPPAVVPAYPLLAPDGLVTAPSYSFASEPASGLYRPASGYMGYTINSFLRLTMSGSGLIVASTPASPGQGIGWGATATAADLILGRDAADILAQRRTTNAQTFRLYNTFTDASNGEWLEFKWLGNKAVIQPLKNGSGTDRQFEIWGATMGAASPSFRVSTDGVVSIQPYNMTTVFNAAGELNIGGGGNQTAVSGTHQSIVIQRHATPTATSTLLFRPLRIQPTINYSNATPGAGAYEAISIAVTETALPTGQSYMIRAQGGAAGTTDVFSVLRDGEMRALCLRYTVRTAPATPAAGTGIVYLKSDNKLYFKSDAGVETALW